VIAIAACALLASAAAAMASQRTVIGHSVRGRPIVVVRNGEAGAPERVLVIGCVHGNEPAGMRVARRLIGSAPPADAALWIVPTLNPDGVAADTRGNAHGVDLNRNFPFAWRPLGGGEYSGHHPLSEPESRAAERLILRLRPDLTIWFHQPFGLVDRSGADAAIERRFSRLIGLPLVQLSRYPGSATSWQNHTLQPSTAFVVELPAAVGGGLVRRAANAVRGVASEYGSPAIAAGERVMH
jgi:protein MpaA